ncbi:cytochrome-c peroxidase [Methylomonas sp. MED-D]|uniref:cytochrome-c peroxidase n=1 Tax=Methylomonas sp. MED-D TaxID=3418768 RepID=UPI003D01694C
MSAPFKPELAPAIGRDDKPGAVDIPRNEPLTRQRQTCSAKRLAGGWTLLLVLSATNAGAIDSGLWSDSELTTLRSLALSSLPPLPADPSNRFADDPAAAVLGRRWFFDQGLSSNGKVACASCHDPDRDFQDGRDLAKGVGRTNRRAMPLAGMAYSPWLFWDGRKDSQWAQALGPLENPNEHNLTRGGCAKWVLAHYRCEYRAVFGEPPDLSALPDNAGPLGDKRARRAWIGLDDSARDAVNRVFANVGKAIAAFERRIAWNESRFDAYVRALGEQAPATPENSLSSEEIAGLKLFIGKAHCAECHRGPLFTDLDFHNTGVPARPGLPKDLGRLAGAEQVVADEFNCLGGYSDASPEQCRELNFINKGERRLLRAYKPPSLRNVAQRPPYMHAGQFASLEAVIGHYNRAPAAPAGRSEIKRLHLKPAEIRQLAAFLNTLSGTIDSPADARPPESSR